MWRVESGEWRVESGEWRVESGEWRVERGEWRVESGEWRTDYKSVLRGLEEGDAGGEAVEEVFLADGAELSGGEEAGCGEVAEGGADGGRVVVGLVEEAGAAAIAGE